MKKKILTILIVFCLVLSLGIFIPTSVFADELLVEDGYYAFTSPTYLHAGEDITIVGENKVYVINSENKVTEFNVTANKAIFENNELVWLFDGDLFIGEKKLASSVIDFDVKGKKLVYVDNNAMYVCLDFTQNEVFTVTESGFSSVAISGNGVFLKKNMGSYNDVYFCDDATRTVSLYLSYLKKFDTLIFDTKLWGIDGNVLYDMNEKTVVSPYANATSVYGGSIYYLADGCLYKHGEFLIGSGNQFSFPRSIDSNANYIYVVDEKGISQYSYSNNKFVEIKNIATANVSNVTTTALPNEKVYYSINSNVYLNEEIIYSAENVIIDVAIDGDSNIYYSTNDATYKNGVKIYDVGGILAIAPSKKDVYVFSGGMLYKNGEITNITNSSAISFDVDGNGNVYFLKSNSIDCHSYDGSLIMTIPHNAKKPADVKICYEQNKLGKLAIVDQLGHNVIFVNADAYVPSFSADETTADSELVRSTLVDTPLFSDINRSKIITTIKASTLLLCYSYELECNDFLAYVSYKNGNTLVSGYVKRTDLSNATLGKTPRYNTAKTFYDNVILHTLPYGLQEGDNKIVQLILNTNTEINLISKYNVYGEDWYKAEYDGSVGYVSANQIQLGSYVPTVRPDTNAKLIKVAAVYDKIDGKYVEDGIFLNQNTEIQVIGVFDSNTEYTQIKYYDDEAGGTRTCYVKTNTLKYDYVTFEQQFALIAVIILSVSMVIVMIIFAKRKQKTR